MKCLGCDSVVGWDGAVFFAYTCPCGATVLYDDKRDKIAPPASFVLAMHGRRKISHLDYYLGKSNYMSMRKLEMIRVLRELGSVWSWECDECRDQTVERARVVPYPYDYHPDLAKLMGRPQPTWSEVLR